ncbi:hypothetical protein ACP70R_033026 [Stipagrostis hirtigluma subsp. patula]
MASDAEQSPPRRRRRPPAEPRSPTVTTILDLDDNLILEIFLRLPSLPSLVRAALARRSFLAAVRSSPAFRRRFRALHPSPLLGIFFDSIGADIPSFSPVRRRSDPDLAAAVRGADVFLTRLPYHDEACTGWRMAECRRGHLLLINRSTKQIAAYNPLTRSLVLLPTPPDEISHGRRGKFHPMGTFLLSSDEAPGLLRVVSVGHDKLRMRAAVFSSGTGEWQILPWSGPCPAQPSGKKYWLLLGEQANGNLYWAHAKQAYQVVLDTTTLHFSFIDLPEHLKGRGDLYMTGVTNDGELCIVSVAELELTLYVWFRRADADGVEKWTVDEVIPLEGEILQATEGSSDDPMLLKVWAILDGVVYMTLHPPDVALPCWFLSFCLETRKLRKIVNRTFDNGVHAYIMAWPPSLVGNM